MNVREMRLLVVLLVILGAGGSGILVYNWFYKPLKAYNAQIEKLKTEVEDKDLQLIATLADRKLLDRARMMSLSPNLDGAQAEYGRFLAPLLNESGLELEDFRVTEATDTKAGAGQPNALKPGHRIVQFQIRAKGELAHLVKTLEVIQKTPLVHRVKTLTIDRVDTSAKNSTDKLNIGMKIEAMIVGRAEPHADGPLAPDQRLVALEVLMALERAPTGLGLLPWAVGPTGPFARQALAMERGYRLYNEMERKNIFRGGEPPKKIEPEPEVESFLAVADYVRLEATDTDNKEAYLRNLIFKESPKRVRSSSFSGFNTFAIFPNELRTRALFTGKVLRIDQRDMYFQVHDEIYGVHLGQSLGEAMRRPLSTGELDRLDLTRLYDAEWAARQAKEAKDNQQAAKKKGGGKR